MQTIKIELEDHIYKKVVDSGVNLQERFKEMIYDFLDDGYPAITTEEAKRRVSNAVKSYKDKSMKTIPHENMWNDIESDCRVIV